ncbi:MAG: 1-acyl-sn-glycerol-3-phosphate acyltransferase [Phycisphaerales bacterium]|nr:MAG: 1-acyl-sn-glycerol-3-phosphate acyltransferase [Phycisphaerales bacterium]
MQDLFWFILVVVATVAAGWLAIGLGRLISVFEHGPRSDDPLFNMGQRIARWYARRVHRLEVEGYEHLADAASREGGIVLVANHTAGVDPVLIQAVAPLDVRWMMAEDMRLPALEGFWRWMRIIFVPRETGEEVTAERAGERGSDRGESVREAIRHVQAGGVLGLFPEGGIERPERTLLPFMPGLGLIVARTRAPVLPVVVEGTPQVDPAWSSLWRRSRSKLTFLPVIEPDEWRSRGRGVASELRDRYAAHTGWPTSERPAGIIPGKGVPERASARASARGRPPGAG